MILTEKKMFLTHILQVNPDNDDVTQLFKWEIMDSF